MKSSVAGGCSPDPLLNSSEGMQTATTSNSCLASIIPSGQERRVAVSLQTIVPDTCGVLHRGELPEELGVLPGTWL